MGALRTSIAGAVVGTVAAAGLYTGVVSPAVGRTSATSSQPSHLAASVPHAPKVVVTVKAARKAAPKAEPSEPSAEGTAQKVVVHVGAAPKPRATARKVVRRAAAQPAPRRTSSEPRRTHHAEAEDADHGGDHEDAEDEHESEDESEDEDD